MISKYVFCHQKNTSNLRIGLSRIFVCLQLASIRQMYAHKNTFTIGEHFVCLQLASICQMYAQKCLKIKCVSLAFRAQWQMCGERCGDVCWVLGEVWGDVWGMGRVEVGVEKCGEVCWGGGK